MAVDSIMELSKAGKFRECNVCEMHYQEPNADLKELKLGYNKQSIGICLCRKCRDKLTEMLLMEGY